MTVDPKHHRYFVAKRGEVLRNIADEFGGVVVSFPRNGVVGDKVRSLRELWPGGRAPSNSLGGLY